MAADMDKFPDGRDPIISWLLHDLRNPHIPQHWSILIIVPETGLIWHGWLLYTMDRLKTTASTATQTRWTCISCQFFLYGLSSLQINVCVCMESPVYLCVVNCIVLYLKSNLINILNNCLTTHLKKVKMIETRQQTLDSTL